MKTHASVKSSFTLGPAEHAQVKRLKRMLKARSNAEVIRRSLAILEESLNRQTIRAHFREAVERVRSSTARELKELEGVAADGLGDE